MVPLYYARDASASPRLDRPPEERAAVAGLAVQRRPDGDGLRPEQLPARRPQRLVRDAALLRCRDRLGVSLCSGAGQISVAWRYWEAIGAPDFFPGSMTPFPVRSGPICLKQRLRGVRRGQAVRHGAPLFVHRSSRGHGRSNGLGSEPDDSRPPEIRNVPPRRPAEDEESAISPLDRVDAREVRSFVSVAEEQTPDAGS